MGIETWTVGTWRQQGHGYRYGDSRDLGTAGTTVTDPTCRSPPPPVPPLHPSASPPAPAGLGATRWSRAGPPVLSQPPAPLCRAAPAFPSPPRWAGSGAVSCAPLRFAARGARRAASALGQPPAPAPSPGRSWQRGTKQARGRRAPARGARAAHPDLQPASRKHLPRVRGTQGSKRSLPGGGSARFSRRNRSLGSGTVPSATASGPSPLPAPFASPWGPPRCQPPAVPWVLEVAAGARCPSRAPWPPTFPFPRCLTRHKHS